MITLHSLQAWWYINMLGEYDLSNDRLRDNTGVLPPKMKIPMAKSVPMLGLGRGRGVEAS
ncbi:MAG: hypothetical protein OXF56_04815 [Rhodobacteraceae bacterium]|nr:hypothetical protein [Paracoccaceae bacterium]